MDLNYLYYLNHDFVGAYPMLDSIDVNRPWVVEEELTKPLVESNGHPKRPI